MLLFCSFLEPNSNLCLLDSDRRFKFVIFPGCTYTLPTELMENNAIEAISAISPSELYRRLAVNECVDTITVQCLQQDVGSNLDLVL